MPHVDIGEMVLGVMSRVPGFLESFTSVSGGEGRLEDLNISIAAALTAPSSPRGGTSGHASATSTRTTCGTSR